MNNPNESQTRPVELPEPDGYLTAIDSDEGRIVSLQGWREQSMHAYAERYAAAETKRADALAVGVKELEAERDQHRARADAIESAANEVKFDYYYDLPAEVSKLFDGAKTLTVLNMPTIRKLRSLLKAFDAERGDVKGDCDA